MSACTIACTACALNAPVAIASGQGQLATSYPPGAPAVTHLWPPAVAHPTLTLNASAGAPPCYTADPGPWNPDAGISRQWRANVPCAATCALAGAYMLLAAGLGPRQETRKILTVRALVLRCGQSEHHMAALLTRPEFARGVHRVTPGRHVCSYGNGASSPVQLRRRAGASCCADASEFPSSAPPCVAAHEGGALGAGGARVCVTRFSGRHMMNQRPESKLLPISWLKHINAYVCTIIAAPGRSQHPESPGWPAAAGPPAARAGEQQ